MSKFKVLELFGGIGACSKALERLGIDYEIADYVEIDKYAVASFNAIHNTNFEPQDICEWNKDIEVDLIMHGSPCQDFSLAGKQAGGDKDSGTRSSLMYETIRIVEKLKPKYVIWENVKNLLSKKHIHNFNAYLETMEQLGYTNYYQVLNAKDYGIPQNRERVFTVSILKENVIYDDYNSNIRKDQDTIGTLTTNCGSSAIRNGWKIIEYNQNFEFPQKQEFKLKLKDMLEDEVDEKYYLSESMIKYISATGTANFKNPDCKINLDIARPLTTNQNKRAGTTNYISNQLPNNYDLNLKSKQKQLISLIEKTNFEEGKVLNMDLYNQTTNENISQCLTEPHHNSQRLFDGLRIRKLTPKECFRLMGFDDEDADKALQVNSNTQLYKQAGNSIVVNVLEAILRNLLNTK
jgi:DNA (cytosine-5)-methyltransferase 1